MRLVLCHRFCLLAQDTRLWMVSERSLLLQPSVTSGFSFYFLLFFGGSHHFGESWGGGGGSGGAGVDARYGDVGGTSVDGFFSTMDPADDTPSSRTWNPGTVEWAMVYAWMCRCGCGHSAWPGTCTALLQACMRNVFALARHTTWPHTHTSRNTSQHRRQGVRCINKTAGQVNEVHPS